MAVRFSTRVGVDSPRVALTVLLMALSCGGKVARELGDDDGEGGTTSGSGGGSSTGGSFTGGGMGALPAGGGADGGTGAIAGFITGGAGAVAGRDTGTGGSIPTCPAGKYCIAPIPKGWAGPIAAHDSRLGGDAPLCSGAYSRTEAPMHARADGGAHCCSCSCQMSGGLFCGEATFEFFDEDACAGAPNATLSRFPTGTEACFSVLKPTAEAYGSVRLASIAPIDAGSTCDPVAQINIGKAAWADTLKGCLADAPPRACGAEAFCTPAPAPAFNLGICIYAEGESTCPKGFPGRYVRYRELADDRTCAECSCGSPSGDCKPHVEISADQSSCESGAVLEAVGDCRSVIVPSSVASLRYNYSGTPRTGLPCPASKGRPLGQLKEQHPVTVCCDRALGDK